MNPHKWYFDTGCETNMSNNLDFCTSLLSADNICTRDAHGNLDQALGIGTFELPGETILNLQDVIYNPNLTASFISGGWLDKNGYSFAGSDGTVKIFKQDQLICTGHLIDGSTLYEMNFNSSKFVGFSSVTEIDSEVVNWHIRLGYINPSYLNRFFKLYKINLKCPNDFKCFVCLRAKSKRLPHRISSINGTEYTNQIFSEICSKSGIIQQFTIPNHPQSNGVSERKNGTLLSTAKCLLFGGNVNLSLWPFAIQTANFISNRFPNSSINFQIPFQMFFNKSPDHNDLFKFGSRVIFKENFTGSKFNLNSHLGIIVGYPIDQKGITVWSDGRLITTRDYKIADDAHNLPDLPSSITFQEEADLIETEVLESNDSDFTDSFFSNIHQSQEIVDLNQVDDRIITDVIEKIPKSDSNCNYYKKRRIKLNRTQLNKFKNDHPSANLEFIGPVRTKSRGKVSIYNVKFIQTPSNYHQAIKSNESSHWLKAMLEEIVQLEKCNTWNLVPLPANRTLIRGMWVFKVKLNDDFTIDRYKARWVAKGFTQRYGLDYLDTYSPVIRPESIFLLFSIAAQYNLTINHIDIKCAYLNGKLDE